MAALPFPQPRQLSLGPLEREILSIIWQQGPTTARAIHEQILEDPDRELAYGSVMTVLQRLRQKGWVGRDRHRSSEHNSKAYYWSATVTRDQATQLQAHERLRSFLSVSNPDVVAAFADSLDTASLDQLDAIAQRLRQIREQRERG
ncbi:CopY family transcriptional regulator [filamentous cyanobacterium CCP5]|nr:CopY family transcriptional regulator [filamentous cyanobacterium CCP5]